MFDRVSAQCSTAASEEAPRERFAIPFAERPTGQFGASDDLPQNATQFCKRTPLRNEPSRRKVVT